MFVHFARARTHARTHTYTHTHTHILYIIIVTDVERTKYVSRYDSRDYDRCDAVDFLTIQQLRL